MKRFRIVAGPNGSGKSTLTNLLRRDYAVNFYTMLNADDIYAEVVKSQSYSPALSIDGAELKKFAAESEYAQDVKDVFEDGRIAVEGDLVRFASAEAVNSYTYAEGKGLVAMVPDLPEWFRRYGI